METEVVVTAAEDDPRWARYARQMRFAPVGLTGQQRLTAARAVLVGCGALGSAIAETLVRGGIGHLRLIDRDFVDLTNLQRQVLYTEADVAQQLPKAIAAAEHLRNINSQVTIEPLVVDLESTRALDLLRGFDVILDGTDNFETRFLINDIALELNTPWIYGGVVGSTGQMLTILPGKTPCFRCVMEGPPPSGSAETCDTAGVLAPAVQMVTAWQSTAAIQVLLGVTPPTAGRLLLCDVWEGETRTVSLGALQEVGCPACRAGERQWLTGQRTSQSTVLCGRNAVQVTPATPAVLDLSLIASRWQPFGRVTSNPFLVRVRLNDSAHELSLFRDGRAIIQGTDDPREARALYARYIGP